MGLALTHFALGALLMLLILQAIAPDHPYRHSIAIASGLWALVPDFHYVSPIFKEPLSEIKFTIFGDLFWFHRFLDAIEPGRGSRSTAAIMVVLLLASTVLLERINSNRHENDS